MKTNYHTHCYLCRHAKGEIEDYIKKAVSLNYTELGMSDHGPLIQEVKDMIGYSTRMSFDEYETLYLPVLEKMKEKYKGIISLKSSLEYEYFTEMLNYYPKMKEELDYLVLGQHYVKYNGEYISSQRLDSIDKINTYADTVCEAMDTGWFKILAHPDLYLWGYKKWDAHTKSAAERIIQSAIKNDVIIEINANGIRNTKHHKAEWKTLNDQGEEVIHYPYPNYDFWLFAKSFSVKIMINEDAHNPEFLSDYATLEVENLAKELKIKIINTL